MAAISFDGFVEEILEGRNGAYGLKVSEPHRRKNEQDEWVTVARTFHRVTGAFQAPIEWASFFKGDRVTVVGKQITDPYTDRENVKRYPLVVKAESVTLNAGRGEAQSSPGLNGTAQTDPWSTPNDSGAQAGAEGWAASGVPF